MTYSYSGPMGPDSLADFLEQLNSQYSVTSPGILPLPMSLFWTSMSVLNMVISAPFPHETQQYLHYHSCHPTSNKCSIPYSLSTRGSCIYTIPMTSIPTPQTSLEPSLPIGTQPLSFTNSYSGFSITLPLPPPPPDPNLLPLITTSYPGLQRLKWILREGFHIFSSDPSNQDLLTKSPYVTFRKPPKLCQLIVDMILRPHWLPTLQ